MIFSFIASSPQQTAAHASCVAAYLSPPLRIYLSGELGAGKTHWVRAVLRARGEQQTIPSPSFALVYSYCLENINWHHLDCYRLQGGEIGEDLQELLEEETAICLLEWPKAVKHLSPPDLTLEIDFVENSLDGIDNLDDQRRLTMTAHSPQALAMLKEIKQASADVLP